MKYPYKVTFKIYDLELIYGFCKSMKEARNVYRKVCKIDPYKDYQIKLNK